MNDTPVSTHAQGVRGGPVEGFLAGMFLSAALIAAFLVGLLLAALIILGLSGGFGPPAEASEPRAAVPGAAPAVDAGGTRALAPVAVDSTGAAPGDTVAAGVDTSAAPADTTGPLSERVRLTFMDGASRTVPSEEPPEHPRIVFEENRLAWGDRDHAIFRSWGRYNRVQGIAAYAAVERPLPRTEFVPAWHAEIGYGFASRRGDYGLGFEQPVAPRHKATVGVDAYRAILPTFYGDEVIGNGENSASAFFLHRDYRDWYEAEGGRAYVGVYPSPFFRFSLGVTSREERSLRNEADWSVFRQAENFGENPTVAEGDYHAYDVAAVYDSRPREHGLPEADPLPRSAWGSVEHYYRLGWERAGAGLGGDFDLWRVGADLRTYFRLSGRQSVSTRILAGSGRDRSGMLPPQRRYVIGGLGTLRGHDYRSLAGDHVALANLEYAFNVLGTSSALVFLDAGTAWDQGSLTDQFIPVDLGTGIRLGEDGMSFLVGRSVNRSDAEVKAFLRFQESF